MLRTAEMVVLLLETHQTSVAILWRNAERRAIASRHQDAYRMACPVQGPRKKRTRREPRQYTFADLERARERGAAAGCKIADNSDPLRGIFASKSDPF